ncbi:MAG: polysaccharide biosynthesis/export family protein, partial [Candidatus Omnitrophota bacterium]|nr:polysaccharide biosynthesis/export family protein [Candidatus Omnitrophota bacterium]
MRIINLPVLFLLFICVQALASEEFPRQASASTTEDAYLLSPSDEIDIKAAGEDDLSGIYMIDNGGNITFPVLGKVSMDGLTVSQAGDKLARLLEKDYFKIKLNVYVQVKKFHKRKVVISGEVNKPGPYEFDEDKNLTLSELITLAGGPTEKACMNAASIIRSNGKDDAKTFKIRAGDIMEAKEKDIILTAGDRVNIPGASVIVMGEVAKPGTYSFGSDN